MQFLEKLSPYVHWGLRLSLAATFLYHGFGKLPPDQFAQMIGGSMAVAWAVALTELAAGILLLVGAFSKEVLTRIGGLLVMVIMIGAIVLVHAKNGWNAMEGGMEFQVLMLATGLYFAARGNNV